MNQSFCKECGGRCVYTASDLTCTQCGLEQGQIILQDEFNVMDRVCTITDRKSEECKSYQMSRREVFNILESSALCPTEDQMTEAMRLYDLFYEKNPIKGLPRRLELACACYHHVCNGIKTQQYICDNIHGISSFQWACKELNKLFGFSIPSQRLQDPLGKTVRIIANDLSLKLRKEEASLYKDLRSQATRLFDHVKHDPRITSIQPEKLNAALVFMASKYMKINATLKRVATLLQTSEPTILKIERIIKNILTSSAPVLS